MARKAKLDILEIAPEESDGAPRKDTGTVEESIEDASIEKIPGGSYASVVAVLLRKPLFWIVFLSVTLLSSAAGILFVFNQDMGGKIPLSVQKEQTVSVGYPQEAKQGILFEGIVVDQKDENGDIRIIFCDVVLDMDNNKTTKAINGDRTDVRKVIFDVLKNETVAEGLSPEGRGRMKEKLKNKLKGLLDEDPVKGVYFTRYELD
jgi:flagellar basal body-associated protein FliL